jgi:hypothetical protein
MPCRILKAYMQEMEKLDLSPPDSPDALQYRPVSLEGPRLLGLVGLNVETSISTTHHLEVGNVPILQVSNSEDPLLRCNEGKAGDTRSTPLFADLKSAYAKARE